MLAHREMVGSAPNRTGLLVVSCAKGNLEPIDYCDATISFGHV